jgi:hypothetical protein
VAPQAQNTSFLSTNIGLLVTQKDLGGLTSFTMVQLPEISKNPEDREKKAKNRKVQVDLIVVSSFGAEIYFQSRSNYAKVSTFFFFFFRPPSVTGNYAKSTKPKKPLQGRTRAQKHGLRVISNGIFIAPI